VYHSAGPQPAYIFGGRGKTIVTCCIIFGIGQNGCSLLLHQTTKHVFENFGGQLPGCGPVIQCSSYKQLFS